MTSVARVAPPVAAVRGRARRELLAIVGAAGAALAAALLTRAAGLVNLAFWIAATYGAYVFAFFALRGHAGTKVKSPVTARDKSQSATTNDRSSTRVVTTAETAFDDFLLTLHEAQLNPPSITPTLRPGNRMARAVSPR